MNPEQTASAVVDEVLPDFATMSEEDRTKFIETGEFPTTKTSDGSAKTAAESGAVSDTAKTGQEPATEEPKPRETRAERRIRQLNDKVKALEAQLSAKPGTETRTESTVAVSTSKAPKLKSFTDQIGTKYGDYDAAHEAWEDARDAFHVEERRLAVAEALKEERAKLDQAKTQETVKAVTQENAKEFAKRAEAFRKTLKEDKFQEHFADVYEAVNDAMAERPEVGKIADKLVALEVGPQLIHYFGQNPDEFDELLAQPIDDALFELGKLAVSEKIKAPPPKTTTAAKRIGSQVHGSAAATVTDEEVAAVESNKIEDFLKAKKINVSW